MSFTYSRQSFKFLEVTYQYVTFMGIAPSYDFDRNVFVKRNVYKLYCLALVSVIVCTFVYQQYYYWKNLFVTYTFFSLILDLFSKCIMFLLCLVTTVSSAFWSMDDWGHLFQCFSELEDELKTRETTEGSFLKNFHFQFFLTHVLVIVVSVNSFIPWFLYVRYPTPMILIAETMILYLQYMKCIKATIVYNIALAIKCKYQDLNRFLIRGCCDRISEIPKITRDVSHLYGLVGETVDAFNKLFGWEILFSIFHSTSITLECFNFIKIFHSQIVSGSITPPLQLLSNLIILSIFSMVSFICN